MDNKRKIIATILLLLFIQIPFNKLGLLSVLMFLATVPAAILSVFFIYFKLSYIERKNFKNIDIMLLFIGFALPPAIVPYWLIDNFFSDVSVVFLIAQQFIFGSESVIFIISMLFVYLCLGCFIWSKRFLQRSWHNLKFIGLHFATDAQPINGCSLVVVFFLSVFFAYFTKLNVFLSNFIFTDTVCIFILLVLCFLIINITIYFLFKSIIKLVKLG